MIDWKEEETRLYKFTLPVIARFAQEHPTETAAAFMYDSEPRYGYVYIGIDSVANNRRSAQHREQFAIQQQRKYLKKPTAWKYAKHHVNTPVLSPVEPDSGDFAFAEYAELSCPQWTALLQDADYPPPAEHEDDYLEGNVRLIFLRVIDRLVKERAFKAWRLGSPFMLGYAFHDEGATILRFLNWPGAD